MALTIALVIWGYMSMWFVLSIVVKRNDIADIAWGLGFILVSWISWFVGGQSEIGFVLGALVTVWGFRLAWHIFRRNLKKGEDYRYLEWRETWKFFYLRSYLQVFLLQGFFMYSISFPVWFLNSRESLLLSPWSVLGISIWGIGFAFEVIGDAQLREFVLNPSSKGKLMVTGLWEYSRHPNYFGEIVQWWGIFVSVLAVTGNISTILGPLTITWLLVFVSGVPMLERKYEGRVDWELYKKKTSALIPWFPKK